MHYIKMVDISRKTYERNGVETIVDNDVILWFNEKYMEEELGDQNVRETAIKYTSNHRKHRYELIEEPKKQCNRTFIDEKLSVNIIMSCETTSGDICRARLGFKQYDVILTKEQSALTKIVRSFEGENMQTEYNVLSYRMDFYFHESKWTWMKIMKMDTVTEILTTK